MEHLVYLAGPITGQNYAGATDWREYARDKFVPGTLGLSPMRAKEYLADMTVIGDHYDDYFLSTSKAIMGRDSYDVRRCDMLLVNLLGATRVSIGTMLEVGMAYALNKPVVLCMEDGAELVNIHDHAMVREAAAWIVPTLDDAILVINATLGVK